jgi:hypothetical protein
MKVLRTLASVLGSYIVVFGIVLLSDPVLEHFYPGQYVRGQVPPVFLLWITTGIFAAASILGGWMCVRIAPSRPSMHLLALFVLGEVFGALSTWANWGRWPHWHMLVWMAIWPVCIWVGALGRRSREIHPTPPIS